VKCLTRLCIRAPSTAELEAELRDALVKRQFASITTHSVIGDERDCGF